MTIGEYIKKLRKQKGLQQKEVAIEVGLSQSNYNKVENDHRQPSIEVLNKLAKLFDVTIDQLLNPDDHLPKVVTVEDKTANEKIKLIEQLEDEDRNVIYSLIDTMLTKKKFQDFFQQNIAVK
ncbi:MAG: helix-turn-helix domain-containing protein [Bacteroidales bacterium]|nr:helix-turn-helix domain-containing protein [Bacteroidales bacterium]